MYRVAILEPHKGQIASVMQNHAAAFALSEGLMISKSERFHDFSQGTWDLFILSASALLPENPKSIDCRFFLAPGATSNRILNAVSSTCVVTYGMSGRDSITLSSFDEAALVLALERELVTLDGKILERQELPVQFCRSISADDFMAAAGALLLSGIPTGDICSMS